MWHIYFSDQLPYTVQPLWAKLFQHFLALINYRVFSAEELADKFAVYLIANNSDMVLEVRVINVMKSTEWNEKY